MEGDNDVVGGKLTISFFNGTHRTVALDEDDAYDLLRYAQKLQARRSKKITTEGLDRIVWPMYQEGMSVPEIARRMEISQLKVEGSIKRVESGRYGIEGGFAHA